MSKAEKKRRGDRLRALRVALGFETQQALADAANDNLERTTVVQAETGTNVLTSFPLIRAFAKALGVGLEELYDYLGGSIDVADVLRRREEQQAKALLRRLGSLPRLRTWIESAANDVTVTELARAAALVESGRAAAYTSINDVRANVPDDGLHEFFQDIRGDRIKGRPSQDGALDKIRATEGPPAKVKLPKPRSPAKPRDRRSPTKTD